MLQRRVSLMRAMRTALLGLAIGGCGWDTPQSTLIAASDFAREIHGLYAIITWAAVGIAAVVPMTLENVAAWVVNPAALTPGAKLPALPLTKDETRALAAYLVSLK